MPRSDLIDDIDYSSLHSAAPTSAPAKAKIQDRQFKKEGPKAQAAEIDMEGLKTQATQAKASAGVPELSPSPLDYVIPGIGILGGLYLLNQAIQSKPLPRSPKPDMRTGISPSGPSAGPLPTGLSPAEFDALSPEDKALVIGGGQNTIAKQAAQQELAQQVNKLQTELASIPQTANPVPVPKEEPQTKFAKDFEVKYGVPLATAEQISGGKITKQWEADIVGNAIKNQLPITVKKEAPVIATPTVTTQPATMAAPIAPTPEPVATTAPVAPVATIEKSESKAKKPVDPSEAGLTKQEIGMKRYLESFYGGGEVGAKTYGQVGEILGYRPAFDPGKGGGLKPEENLKIKGYRKENIEGPKVNLDKDMKRALKGGAGAAALMAIPGFADAAQRKDYGRMAELASDFVVPPFAGSTELGVSTLGEKQLKAFENAQKLGSPYRSVPPR